MTVHDRNFEKLTGMRFGVICLLAVFCLLFVPASAHAEEIGELSGTWYINDETGYKIELHDDASLLEESELRALAENMKGLTKYGSVGFFTSDTEGFRTSELAHSLYDEYLWKQSSGTESGTMFLIDMANRKIYIYSNGVIYKTITNAYANTITDNVYKHATRGDYYKCAREVFLSEQTLLEGRKIAQPMKYVSNLFLALALAILINYILVKLFSRAKSPSDREMLAAIAATQRMNHVDVQFDRETKTYSPQSSGGGGGGRSGGGGGGSSGGGGGHSF